MKLTSEKILWAIYDLMETTDKTLNYIPRSPSFMTNFEYYRLLEKLRLEKNRKEFGKLIYYLKTRKYIGIKIKNKKKFISLTQKGQEKIFQFNLKKIKKRKRRDKKWVLVVFDIPEELRKSRDFLRRFLKFLDFEMVQQSVWLSSIDALDMLQTFIKQYSLEEYVKILLVEPYNVKALRKR